MNKMAKFTSLALLLVLLFSLGATSDASASKPYCNNVVNTELMFQGNVFSVTWTSSPRPWRVFVAWPLDDRDHWAAYELILREDSVAAPLDHSAFGFVDLPVDFWTHGQLIIMLTENSAQEGHAPPQTAWEHGQLLEVLQLTPQQRGQNPPEGPPLCKAGLTPVMIQEVP